MPRRRIILHPIYTTLGGTTALTYAQKLLTLQPDDLLALWPLTETSGTTAINANDPGTRDGTHTGVTLNDAVAPDGSPAPFYDGINDSTDVHTASLATAFDGTLGTMMCWAKVYNAGVWTDSTDRFAIRMHVDGNNFVGFLKRDTTNEVELQAKHGGSYRNIASSLSTTDWFHLAMTWDASGNSTIFYVNGVEVGSASLTGTWAGSIGSATVGSAGGGSRFHGWLSHPIVHSAALLPSEILYAYNQATA